METTTQALGFRVEGLMSMAQPKKARPAKGWLNADIVSTNVHDGLGFRV